jgi:hypothetical protein
MLMSFAIKQGPRRSNSPTFQPSVGFSGDAGNQFDIATGLQRTAESYRRMQGDPFHAMVEADVEIKVGHQSVLWYVNTKINTNETFKTAEGYFGVLSWTHPGVQVALSHRLGQKIPLSSGDFALRSVVARARARFTSVLPLISGTYEPGGPVVAEPRPKTDAQELPSAVQRAMRPESADVEKQLVAPAGLKSVKLDMTPEQVEAFIAKMDGLMLITGAPGTGKTTVALQRIRFLLDQQDDELKPGTVRHSADSTRVFLANENLQSYVEQLLKSELQLPHGIVSVTPAYIKEFITEKWSHKNGAVLRMRETDEYERRGREAFFSTCSKRVLNEVWETFELQIKKRLETAANAKWSRIAGGVGEDARDPFVGALLQALYDKMSADIVVVDDPRDSALRMDSLFSRMHTEYEACRDAVMNKPGDNARQRFDSAFSVWLYWVYDSLEALSNYFIAHRDDGVGRVYSGIGDHDEANNIVDKISEDWKADSLGRGRIYGVEEFSWVAWLLRFALPEEMDSKQRFRSVGVALPRREKFHGRWNHVVIDEAQDLSVQEASFLASLVTLRGALTVSADFKQLVSPVHGMKDIEPIKFGSSMRKAEEFSPFRFGQNLRQAKEIGIFLAEVYQAAFGEKAPFRAGPARGKKPELYIRPIDNIAATIAQILSSLKADANIRSVAVIHIDEGLLASRDLHESLVAEGAVFGEPGMNRQEVLFTTAERAKGLEFDACIILGLEDVERSPLNHSKNRAYVALSRPTKRLLMVCGEFPSLLEHVAETTYDRSDLP